MAEPIKILMTHSYGAGWSTWCEDPEIADFMLTYQPIIDYISKIEDHDIAHDLSEQHPLVVEMLAEIERRFPNHRLPCVGGAKNLGVETTYRKSLVELLGIKCHDGNEYFD